MTVGLVVVSHSRALGMAAVALAREMVGGQDVPISVAAGLDQTTLGTDAAAIVEAIAEAERGQGVVVLMDLGSAVLSAELALEMLDEDARDRVVLSGGPLVEGLVAAAVTAAGGADTARVAAEAAGALAPKINQLESSTRADTDRRSAGAELAVGSPPVGSFRLGSFVVAAADGLHARPAARLVAEVARHGVTAELRNRTSDSAWVPADSLAAVMTLGCRRGDELELKVWGPLAAQVIDGVTRLAGDFR
ncbi:MAG: hypothetical protein FGM52_08235 [Mycobacterium sp.]|nr:hypothetical protein [Mycobacterium sp.]